MGAIVSATTRETRGDVGRYFDSRQRVLGQVASVPLDEDTAAEVLSEIHGGPRRAAGWLRQVLARLDTRDRTS